ncbi:MAG TPA: PEP-CTERM sorting domain-containing protein [Gammaproteobacteria bacterium]|nr:PEP-CTERM sorting domain-containing protein [Gammaproteobacteria bacterium]
MNITLKTAFACLLSAYSITASAIVSNVETITFDSAIDGETSHLFDGDGDGVADVIFSTMDPFGFNTAGPGPNQLYISEPGLEGTTGLTPDLRVDFLQGAVGSIGFGFATTDPMTGVAQVFDQAHNQIGSQVFAGEYFDLTTEETVDFPGFNSDNIPNEEIPFGEGSTSGFPEGRVEIPFADAAAYVIIDFNSEFGGGRYIIDNFTYEAAGTDTLTLFEGADPNFPKLPDPFDSENPEFQFELETLEDGLGTLFPIFVDPIIAVGYEYSVSGSTVTSVLIPQILPNGDGDFTIVIDGISYTLTAGVIFDILTETGNANGVSSFKILDIDTTEALDPADALAFNTGLTFLNAGTVNVTQTPITVNTSANNVPEPGTLLLILLGLLGVGSAKKYRWQ